MQVARWSNCRGGTPWPPVYREVGRPRSAAPTKRYVEFLMSESKNLWGGRFKGKSDPGFAEFNNSFRFDRRLFEVDIVASIAWCRALERAGVLTAEEANQIRQALESVRAEGASVESAAEDVHSFVEARLVDMIGD